MAVSKAQPSALLRAELKHAKELNAELLAALESVHADIHVRGEVMASTVRRVLAAIAKAKAQP